MKILLAIMVLAFVSCNNSQDIPAGECNDIKDSLTEEYCPQAEALYLEGYYMNGVNRVVVYRDTVFCNQD